ncbi:MAG: Bax inhibitor-1/YccA family protein, partial [Actinomycetota bacterium]|nr:Bax inhibitor-1/YccA family protein [Actinomycetota bacterium]
MATNSRFNESNNPVLSRYEKADQPGFAYDEGRSALKQATGAGGASTDQAFDVLTAGGGLRLTLNDVIIKSTGIFAVTVVMAVVGWNTFEAAPYLMWIAAIVGLGLGFANALKREVSPILVIVYAAVQGIFLGGISTWYNSYAESVNYQGLVQQAVLGT